MSSTALGPSGSVALPAAPNGCSNIGDAMPDLAGIGVLISFSGQALLSLVIALWVFILSSMGKLGRSHVPKGSEEYNLQTKKLETFSELLMAGSDIQMLLGIALQVTAYTKRNKLGLYHLRLVYDTVSFVGVSSAAALVCLSLCHAKLNRRVSRRSPRFLATYFFAALFVALTITLVVHLARWDVNSIEPGMCYSTVGTGPVYAPHPKTDIIYVCITAFIMLFVELSAALAGPKPGPLLLLLAFAQYPVHLYFMITVRHNNQPLLRNEGEEEDTWDFGQTTAMLLLLLAYVEVVEKTRDYFSWRKENKSRRLLGGGPGGPSESDLSLAEYGHSRVTIAPPEPLVETAEEETPDLQTTTEEIKVKAASPREIPSEPLEPERTKVNKEVSPLSDPDPGFEEEDVIGQPVSPRDFIADEPSIKTESSDDFLNGGQFSDFNRYETPEPHVQFHPNPFIRQPDPESIFTVQGRPQKSFKRGKGRGKARS